MAMGLYIVTVTERECGSLYITKRIVAAHGDVAAETLVRSVSRTNGEVDVHHIGRASDMWDDEPIVIDTWEVR